MTERISVVEGILNRNTQAAELNRITFDKAGIFTVNIMASPGAGKTSLIELTIKNLSPLYKVSVIDGDIASLFRQHEGYRRTYAEATACDDGVFPFQAQVHTFLPSLFG